MRGQLATGQEQADLTLRYSFHEGTIKEGIKLKDAQVVKVSKNDLISRELTQEKSQSSNH